METHNQFFAKAVTVLLVLFVANFAAAQDIHFSNTLSAPLQLNPALAGSERQVNASLISRTQWRAVPAPFNTLYGSADFYVKSESNWNFITGLEAYNDRSGDPTLITNAFNLYLGSKVKTGRYTSLSASLGAGYRQLSTRPDAGQWASQFNGSEYDGSINSGEQFARLQLGGLNTSAGLMFKYSTENPERKVIQTKKEFRFGVAAYNLNRPANAFLNGGENRLPVRFTAFATGEFGISGKKSTFLPAIIYQRQGTMQELLVGASVRYNVRNASQYTYYVKQFSTGLGLYLRAKDAVIVRTFMTWGDFELSLAYDINSSLLRQASHLRGAFEFALRFNLH